MKRRNFILGSLAAILTGPKALEAATKAVKKVTPPQFADPMPNSDMDDYFFQAYGEERMTIVRIDVYSEGQMTAYIQLVSEDDHNLSGEVEAIWTERVSKLQVGDTVKVNEFRGHTVSSSLTYEQPIHKRIGRLG